MRTTFSRMVAVAAVGIMALVGVGASSARAEVSVTGFYKVAYADTVFYYYNNGSTAFQYPLTYEQWVSFGRPQPTLVPSEVVKYAWSPTLYAVTFFQGDWEWERLDTTEWQRLAFKAPYNAGWIDGSRIEKYASSTELFLTGEDGSVHKLTFPEYIATGPQAYEDAYSGEGFVKYRGSVVIQHVFNFGTNNESGYPITYAEWASYDFPTPALR